MLLRIIIRLSLVVVSLCTNCSVFAQGTFQKTFGNDYGNQANSVELTDDGGYIVAGWYDVQGLFTSEFYLIKTNENGDTLWARTYGTKIDSNARHNGGNLGYHAIQSADGGYLMVGEIHGFGAGLADVYVVKTDSNGKLIWSRTYGTSEADYSEAVLETSDGDFVIVGFTEATNVDLRDAYMLKISDSGTLIWSKTFGGESIDALTKIVETFDGGLMAVGYSFSFGEDGSDVYAIKTDSDGNIEWQKTYGGIENDWGYSVVNTLDSCFALTGTSLSYGAGNADIIALKLDSLGSVIWSKAYGGIEYESGQSIEQCHDGNLAITGHTRSFGAGDEDVLLLRLQSDGEVISATAIGSDKGDFGRSIKQTNDLGFVIAGYTNGFGVNHSDVYLIKTDSTGINGCHDTSVVVESSAITHTINSVVSSVGSAGKAGTPATLTGFTISTPSEPCDFVIGTSELKYKEDLLVYPNPTQGNINLDLEGSGSEEVCITVRDLMGRVIQMSNQTFPSTMDLSNLSIGLYLIHVVSERTSHSAFIQKI